MFLYFSFFLSSNFQMSNVYASFSNVLVIVSFKKDFGKKDYEQENLKNLYKQILWKI